MDRGVFLFVGCLLTFTSSWLGLVFLPQAQLTLAQPSDSLEYPIPLTEEEERGRKVYQSMGCIYCHSQQIRSQKFGNNADIERGWGTRRTVPRDYALDRPIMLGTSRTGPDLADIGSRNPDPNWHLLHLYNPRMMSPGSIMPAFGFLFEKQPKGETPSEKVLPFEGAWKEQLGEFEIVPKQQALDLVAYLKALKKRTPLPEARE